MHLPDQSSLLNFHRLLLMVIHFGYLVQNLGPLLVLRNGVYRADQGAIIDFRKRFSHLFRVF